MSEVPRDENREFHQAEAMDKLFEDAKSKDKHARFIEDIADSCEASSAGHADTSDDYARAQELRNEASELRDGMEAAGDKAGEQYDADQKFEQDQFRDSQDPADHPDEPV